MCENPPSWEGRERSDREMPSWMVWRKVGGWEPGQEVEAKVGALGACSGGLVTQGKPWQGCKWRVCEARRQVLIL